MDQGDQATAAPTTGAVTANGSVLGEVLEAGGGPELGILYASNQCGGLSEDVVKLVVGVGDAIAVKLQDGTFGEGEGLHEWRG